jgi:hypothetical protein
MPIYKEKPRTEEIKEQQPAPETAQQQANGQQVTDLNLNDLAALKSIIDVASSRGAFKAAEMEPVGKIYNKLSTFLDSVTKKD